ncbi:MAG: nuclear transport factor 2 family protein [bacterium]
MDRAGIEKVLQIYFDASFEGSAEKMRRVFRPEAHIYGINEGDTSLADIPRDRFAELVGSTQDAVDPGRERKDEIHFIEFSSEYSAVAKVSLLVGKTFFTDLLTFVYLDGEWRAIAKLYYGRLYRK